MQPWDSWIQNSTDQFGRSFTATTNPATGGKYVPVPPTQEQLLSVRRSIDDDVRYGRPVSAQRMIAANKMGAI